MFENIVQLYRSLGRPSVSQDSFVYEGDLSTDQVELIDTVDRLPSHFGHFEFKRIDGSKGDIEYSLPGSEHGKFYASLEDFIGLTPSLNFGVIPEEFYIVNLDYYSGDTVIPPQVAKLYKLCRFIKALSRLAAEGGSALGEQAGDNRLLFVVAADGKSPAKTLAVPVQVRAKLLDADLAHMRILELIVSDEQKSGIHMEERRTIMRIAIAEVLASVDESSELFAVLVSQWRKVLVKYHHNLLAFVNQYSFEKVRKEIAVAQIDHTTKLSAVLGDIGGKLLALPVSFAAIVLLRKAATREEFWAIFAGMITASIVFVGILLNQWMQVRRIRSSFDFIFGQYDDSAFPKKLQKPILEAKRNIRLQYLILAWTFSVFAILSLAPGIAAVAMWWATIPLSLIDACLLFAK